MERRKNKLTIGLLCYVVWGVLPAYWNLLSGVNPLLILCCRIIFALLSMICLLTVSGRMHVFISTLRDKATMRFLAPASVMIAFNWGLFIWAVNSGHILDSSLGYYMNPLIAFLLGVIIFREKYTKLQLAAVALAFTGVLISVIAYGSFPIISVSLSLTFAAYGVLKKKAGADPNASIAIESLLFTPFALVFALVFMTDSIRSASTAELWLLFGSGIATALPLALYARAVNDIPFIIVGFLQYISPSLTMTYGLLTGETLSPSQQVSFVFIALGLVVFSIALVRLNRHNAKSEARQS
jgi:chloramphenicol-sensitive protein RarD